MVQRLTMHRPHKPIRFMGRGCVGNTKEHRSSINQRGGVHLKVAGSIRSVGPQLAVGLDRVHHVTTHIQNSPFANSRRQVS